MARRKKKGEIGFTYPESKRVEVVTTYLTLGSAPLTAAVTVVSLPTIQHWKLTDWWKDMVRDIMDSENIEMSAKLKRIVDKSIDVALDRIENGDHIFNPRTGEVMRVPIKVREALKAVDTMIDKRQILQEKPTKIVEQRTVDDRLNKLAEEFARFVNSKNVQEAPLEALQSTIDGRVVYEVQK